MREGLRGVDMQFRGLNSRSRESRDEFGPGVDHVIPGDPEKPGVASGDKRRARGPAPAGDLYFVQALVTEPRSTCVPRPGFSNVHPTPPEHLEACLTCHVTRHLRPPVAQPS